MQEMTDVNCRGLFSRFWNKGGFVLCVAGSADICINEQKRRLVRGDVFVLTPLVHICDFVPDAGFEAVSFIDELKVYYPTFRLISDTAIPWRVRENPCWRLSEAEIAYVTAQGERVESKRRLSVGCGSSDERILLAGQIDLIKRETMLEIVGNRISATPAARDSGDRCSAVAYRFILSLHDNYRIRRSVAWYASEAGLSPGHFSKTVRRVTGKSPSEWIAAVTVAYVRFMLEQSDESIKEIAHELNFPEQFTFRKYFKSHVGIPPREYRRIYGGANRKTHLRCL